MFLVGYAFSSLCTINFTVHNILGPWELYNFPIENMNKKETKKGLHVVPLMPHQMEAKNTTSLQSIWLKLFFDKSALGIVTIIE